jgi:hypothetical protein
LTHAELAAALPGFSAESPADRRLVRMTAMNMLRAGQLVALGTRRVPGCSRPALVLGPPSVDAAQQSQPDALQWAMRRWHPGRLEDDRQTPIDTAGE